MIDNQHCDVASPPPAHVLAMLKQCSLAISYSNAFILISQLKHDQVLSHLAQTTSKIVEGEIDQLANENTMISKEKYYDIITAKTGLLFTAENALPCSTQRMLIALRKQGKNLALATKFL